MAFTTVHFLSYYEMVVKMLTHRILHLERETRVKDVDE